MLERMRKIAVEHGHIAARLPDRVIILICVTCNGERVGYYREDVSTTRQMLDALGY